MLQKSGEPPGMVLKPVVNNGINMDKLPTSTGEFAGFQPSTVGPVLPGEFPR